MKMKEVSERYGISPDTLRYYEKAGLIPDIPRPACGWVEFILCMRTAGLPIEALSEYVALWREGNGTADARKQILLRYREKLAARIAELNAALSRLECKIDQYEKLIDIEESLR